MLVENDLVRGDILLLQDTPDNTTSKHKAIKFGQRLTGINFSRHNQGQSNLVHALIYVGYGAAAEASGEAGATRARALPYGTFLVYRCSNQQMGKLASDAALTWSLSGGVGYAKRKAIMSIFHSDDLGKHGANRALAYASAAGSSGGGFGHGKAFCSEFVIASYQAAAQELGLPLNGYVLATDAKHCSVRGLHDRLVRDTGNFTPAGVLRVPTFDMG